MSDDRWPPIEPGPEPDTTDAADAVGPGDPHEGEAPLDPESAPAMIDDGHDHVDEIRI